MRGNRGNPVAQEDGEGTAAIPFRFPSSPLASLRAKRSNPVAGEGGNLVNLDRIASSFRLRRDSSQ